MAIVPLLPSSLPSKGLELVEVSGEPASDSEGDEVRERKSWNFSGVNSRAEGTRYTGSEQNKSMGSNLYCPQRNCTHQNK